MELRDIHKMFALNYGSSADFWPLKEAAEKTNLKESKLRRLAKQEKIRYYLFNSNMYFFIPDELSFDLKNLPKQTRIKKIRKVQPSFKSSFTRFDFAILYSLFIEAKILPKSPGSKKLFCDFLVNNGIFSSIETTAKMFSDYENTIQSKEKIKENFTNKFNNLTTLLK